MLNRYIAILFYALLISISLSSRANEPVKLADTSSPSDTLASFMYASDVVIKHWQDETLQLPEAQQAYAQALRTMDLSLVPNRSRTVVTMERIILLREVIDRFDLDVRESSPDLNQVRENDLSYWRLGNSDIVISKQLSGDNVDQFLFSAATVQSLPRWYRTLASNDYAVKPRDDHYQTFLASPGPLISKRYIQALPSLFNQLYGPLPLWQWFALACVLSLCKVMIKISFMFGDRWNDKWESKGLKWRVGRLISLVSVVLLLMMTRKFIDDGVWLTGGIYQFFATSFLVAQFVSVSWLIMAIFNYFAEIYVFKKHNGKHVDSSLITVLARIVGGLTIVVLGVYVIEYMGFSISPILAGLGVGGLAVALAIRPVLENVINGLTLYADGGIKIGELCRYGEKLGTIESIGLRSTRIRTLERSLITIPNSEFANMEIDNLERRDKRRMDHVLRLRSEISLEQLRVLIVNIRRLLLQHQMTEAEPVRVRLIGVGEFSININIMAYIRCRDNEEFMAVQEDILFAVLAQVESIGAKIAHSNQYQLVKKQGSDDEERKTKAAQVVAKWHEEGAFPFPDFSYEYKHEIKDTILYPQKTSSVR
ncbi:mechanosensitive ion channel family protein [Vibrio sp. PID23_8]|uniref:mechanosensitive ion channel family protein n=1 Tax=Vibrio sp. PID23_8 TaxID=1583767 RepID=UPI000E684210|nr:mechanosensitive ion channel domain-containing protein [Vibrio sp. PID23_8]RIZ55219.1 mechanosensitive ion channel [Vibrio sp. PID23_8]